MILYDLSSVVVFLAFVRLNDLGSIPNLSSFSWGSTTLSHTKYIYILHGAQIHEYIIFWKNRMEYVVYAAFLQPILSGLFNTVFL